MSAPGLHGLRSLVSQVPVADDDDGAPAALVFRRRLVGARGRHAQVFRRGSHEVLRMPARERERGRRARKGGTLRSGDRKRQRSSGGIGDDVALGR